MTYLSYNNHIQHILTAVYGNCDILADFFGESCRQFTAGIELSAADKVWQVVFAFIARTMKQEIFTVKPEGLGSYTESSDFKFGKLRDSTTSWHISKFIYAISGEILADSENSDEIC